MYHQFFSNSDYQIIDNNQINYYPNRRKVASFTKTNSCITPKTISANKICQDIKRNKTNNNTKYKIKTYIISNVDSTNRNNTKYPEVKKNHLNLVDIIIINLKNTHNCSFIQSK